MTPWNRAEIARHVTFDFNESSSALLHLDVHFRRVVQVFVCLLHMFDVEILRESVNLFLMLKLTVNVLDR